MPKLDEILTQLSDLNPEVDYSLEISENCLKLSTPIAKEPESDSESEELKTLKAENDKLKKANMQLLQHTVVEEEKRVEDILYDMFGKTRKGVNE